MNKRQNRIRLFAVFGVLLSLLACFSMMPVATEDSEAASSSDWTCTITISNSSITTQYSTGNGALADTTGVTGSFTESDTSVWQFSRTTGYGPFNSFYAAFDPTTGGMVCHLDPYDLTKSIDSTDISSKGYDIMWCLPKIYYSISGSTLTLSSTSGTLMPAFTLGTTEYNFLGIGVYEANHSSTSSTTDVLHSQSGKTPANSTTASIYVAQAKNHAVDGGVAVIWNYFMYQIYRICGLAVTENFDSQSQIGNGSVSGGSSLTTGLADKNGPYYGTTVNTTSVAKLFIENGWGSEYDYVADTYWGTSYTLYAGQNVSQVTTSGLSGSNAISGFYGYSGRYGGPTYSTSNINSWGLPSSSSSYSSSQSTTYPDYVGANSGCALMVGGAWSNGSYAGLSCLNSWDGHSNSGIGARLAFLFAADPAAVKEYTVTYDGNGGTPGTATQTYKSNGSPLALPSATKSDTTGTVAGGYTTTTYSLDGWYTAASGGTKAGGAGESYTPKSDITLYAHWSPSTSTTYYTVTYNAGSGSVSPTSAKGVVTLPTPTYALHEFTGWYTDASGGTKAGDAGGSYTPTKDITLYAQWKAAYITYDHTVLLASGVSSSEISKLSGGADIASTTQTYTDLGTCGGFTHSGWYVDGTYYAKTATIAETTSHTAYSAWSASTVSVEFKITKNSVWSTYATLYVPSGSVGVALNIADAWIDGVFVGWCTDTALSTAYDSSKAITANTVLYGKGVMPLAFTSTPTSDAKITSTGSNGSYLFDATGSVSAASVYWDFGDGVTSTDRYAYHTYAEDGTYRVALTVTNSSGETDTSITEVVVGQTDDGHDGHKDDSNLWILAVVIAVIVGVLVVRRI